MRQDLEPRADPAPRGEPPRRPPPKRPIGWRLLVTLLTAVLLVAGAVALIVAGYHFAPRNAAPVAASPSDDAPPVDSAEAIARMRAALAAQQASTRQAPPASAAPAPVAAPLPQPVAIPAPVGGASAVPAVRPDAAPMPAVPAPAEVPPPAPIGMQSAAAVAPPPPAAAPAATPAAPPAVAAPPAAGPVRAQIPDVQGLVVLIRNAILGLHQANVAGDYSVMRELAAPDFREANSPANLSNVFADLRSRGIDLGTVTVVSPSLASEPVLNDQGLLRLVGFFPVGGQKIDFDLAFQQVGGRWALISIGVFPPRGEASPPPKPAAKKPVLPESAALIALIRQSVMALGQANMAGDYAVLRGIASPGFREGNSLVKLAKVFAELRARNLDLGPVAVIEPRLFKPAEIDKQGFLRLTGYFPSRPEQVNFDLAFQFVDGDWKLFGIGLNTSREVPQGAAGINQASGFTPPAK